MFSSSDSSASKVGVVNSGKGMTQYGERKRFKFGDAGYEGHGSDEEDD